MICTWVKYLFCVRSQYLLFVPGVFFIFSQPPHSHLTGDIILGSRKEYKIKIGSKKRISNFSGPETAICLSAI
jgi:hypothetical protein